MKQLNRILALLLVLVLVIGVLPVSAFAEELQATEPTISDAAPVETDGSTVSTDAEAEPVQDSEPTIAETADTVPANTESTEVSETESTVPDSTAASEATVPSETSDNTDPTETAQDVLPSTVPALAQTILEMPSLQASRTEDTLWILGEYQINADPTLTFGNNWYDGIRKMYFGSYSNPTYAYCIKPSIETDSNTDYYSDATKSTAAWDALGTFKQQAITLTMAYGFPSNYASALPNSGNGWVQAAQYAATQVIIWEFTEGCRNVNTYKRTSNRIVNSFSDNSNFMSAYNTIAGLLEKHGVIPSFCNIAYSKAPTIELKPDGKGNYVATVTDTKGVLSNWNMPSESGIIFSRSGNNLTITATASAAKRLSEGKTFLSTNPKMPNQEAKSVLTWASSSVYNTYQPVVTFLKSKQDPVPAFFKLKAQATGYAAVKKFSEDGKVTGISFQIKQGSTVLETKQTDSNGNITFTSGLMDGTSYVLHEVTPAGYAAQPDQFFTAVANQTITLTFRNTLERGNLIVTKISAKDGTPLPGISFRLTGTSTTGAAVNVVATTDANGEAKFLNVLVGDNYTLTEIQDSATAAWIVPDPITGIQITAGNTTANPVKVTMKNSDLTIKKVSEDGKVSGITFEISGGDLTSKLTVTTGANGEIHVGNKLHDDQTYTVHEVCPEAYVQPEDQQITVKNDIVNELTFENKLKKWSAHVVKSDVETGYAQGDGTLAGAVYGVYQDGNLVDSYTTDENGAFDTKTYICGEGWYIQEIKPSEGYKLNPGKTPVGAEAKNYTVEFNPLNFFVKEAAVKGKIAIIKTAGGTDHMIPEAGATFQIWLSSAGSYDSAREAERDTITTNEAGFAQTKDLPYGTYTIHQVSGKYGHYLVGDFEVVIGENGKTYYYNLNNAEIRLKIKVVKVDAESGKKIPLAGFGFSFTNAAGEKLTWTNPYPTPTEVSTFYTGADGTLITPFDLPYGTYTATEISTPEPYVRETNPIEFQINDSSTVLDEDGYKVVEIVVPNQIQQGRIKITKTGEGLTSITQDGDLYTPVWGEVGIPGATYNVYAAADYTSPDGVAHYTKGDLVDTVTTDANGEATTKLLYLTSFVVKEDENGVPAGYLLDTEEHHVTLTYAGQEEAVSITALGVKDDRQKASVSLKKSMEQDTTYGLGANGGIQNVRFGLFANEKITALDGSEIPAGGMVDTLTVGTDGKAAFTANIPVASYYAQEIATDEHYILDDTKYPLHFQNDPKTAVASLAVNDGKAIENDLIRGSLEGMKYGEESENGLTLEGAKFGLFPKGTENYAESKAYVTVTTGENGKFTISSIPYGTYDLVELEAPLGRVKDSRVWTVEIGAVGQVVRITATNRWIYGSVTVTKLDTETHEALADAAFTVYTDSNANGKLDPEELASAQIVPETNDSGVYTLEHLRYGHYILAETKAPDLYYRDENLYPFVILQDGQVITIENESGVGFVDQHVPEIHTNAASAGMQDVYTTEFDGITDTVSYKHLIIGKTYTIQGVLMDKAAGQPFLDADGKEITSEVTWAADKTEGEVEVHFDFDVDLITEKTTLVVFESLVKDGIEVASHADLEDVNQTVTIHVPEIHTTATVNDGKVAYNTEITEIVDTVEYTGLIPNVEHTIHGTLMDKATGKELLVDGKPVTAKATFTPETPDGSVEILFKLDGKLILTTTETVAFESLTRNETEIAVHADIDDEGQTVEARVSDFHTTATVNESKDAFSAEDITISDVIHYTGAIPGVELTAKGILMDKATGEAFKDSEGSPVVAEATFTPEDTEGDVTVTFTFDAKALKETTDLVVFETVFHGDVEVGSHKDLEDEGQTVTVHVPELHTTATINGKHDVTTNSTVTIKDKVAYKGLIIGKEYTVKGVLMDKSTKKPYLDSDGKEITAEAKFIADKAGGEITLSFTFDAKGLKKATTLVVFEHLYLEELEIGAHADLSDTDQTVKITPPPVIPHTGNNDMLRWATLGILGVLILATGIVLAFRKRKIC